MAETFMFVEEYDEDGRVVIHVESGAEIELTGFSLREDTASGTSYVFDYGDPATIRIHTASGTIGHIPFKAGITLPPRIVTQTAFPKSGYYNVAFGVASK